jgi:N-acetylmuramic acid 6-phosphate etherase
LPELSNRQVFAEISALTTEAVNPRTVDLDRRTVREVLTLINDEDQSVPGAVQREIDAIAHAVELVVARLERGGRLFYVGAGTSGRLGVLDAAECPPTCGTDPTLVQGIIAGGHQAVWRAIEGAEDEIDAAPAALVAQEVGPADVVVGLAASRRTPFVVAALRHARQVGAGTILVAMNATDQSQPASPDASGSATEAKAKATVDETPSGSPEAPASGAPSSGPASLPELEVDVAICPIVGPEVVMGSTRMKSGTAQKLILNMISTATMVRLGKVYGNLMVDLRATSRKLAERAKRLVMMTTNVDYDTATRLLEEAGGRVKTAIVIGHLGVKREEAEARLARAGGLVRRALEEERS